MTTRRSSPGSGSSPATRAGAPGQLDGELEQEAWIVDEANPDDPFGGADLWAHVLARKGGEYALLARMPPDPSVN